MHMYFSTTNSMYTHLHVQVITTYIVHVHVHVDDIIYMYCVFIIPDPVAPWQRYPGVTQVGVVSFSAPPISPPPLPIRAPPLPSSLHTLTLAENAVSDLNEV